LRGRFQGDAVAELLELADEALPVGVGLVPPVEVVASELLVVGLALEKVPDHH
jgi:hypothetical protein